MNIKCKKVQTLETRKKISLALKGRRKSEDHKRKIATALRGRKLKKKTRMRMSIAKKNMSQDTKDKMSVAKTGENHPLYKRYGMAHPNYGMKYNKS